MKFASFRDPAGIPTFGLLIENDSGNRLLDLRKRLPGTATLRALIAQADWKEVLEAHKALDGDYSLDELTFLPVVPDPDKILCIGINYASHVKETGREMPDKPMVFTRFANSQIGHGGSMIRPRLSERFDFEGELAVIIGRQGRYIEPGDALGHIAGFSCYNDGSVRDWQRHTTQFTPGKNFPATGAFGPWMATPDEVGDIAGLSLTTMLNGVVMQQATLDDLIFDVPSLISYCSQFTMLEPGDVIITGTTGGVGAFREPPVWLKAGDRVSVKIDRIGELTNTVVDEHSN